MPENEISNSFKVFYFIINFFTQKLMVPMIPQVSEVPRSTDP